MSDMPCETLSIALDSELVCSVLNSCVLAAQKLTSINQYGVCMLMTLMFNIGCRD